MAKFETVQKVVDARQKQNFDHSVLNVLEDQNFVFNTADATFSTVST